MKHCKGCIRLWQTCKSKNRDVRLLSICVKELCIWDLNISLASLWGSIYSRHVRQLSFYVCLKHRSDGVAKIGNCSLITTFFPQHSLKFPIQLHLDWTFDDNNHNTMSTCCFRKKDNCFWGTESENIIDNDLQGQCTRISRTNIPSLCLLLCRHSLIFPLLFWAPLQWCHIFMWICWNRSQHIFNHLKCLSLLLPCYLHCYITSSW